MSRLAKRAGLLTSNYRWHHLPWRHPLIECYAALAVRPDNDHGVVGYDRTEAHDDPLDGRGAG